MKQLPSRLNRAWLIVIGLILLLAGAAAVLIGTGFAAQLLTPAGLPGPQPSSAPIGNGAPGLFSTTVAAALVGLAGVVLGGLGLAWLLAQIPRANPAKPYRLQDQVDGGLTSCDPTVLTAAVQADLERLPGVTAADAVLRGTAARPELTVKVTAHDRSDLAGLLQRIQHDTAADLTRALETPLYRLGVQLDLTRVRRTADTVTL